MDYVTVDYTQGLGHTKDKDTLYHYTPMLFFGFFLVKLGFQLRTFALAKQAPYCLSYTSSPIFFFDRLLLCTFQVLVIIGMHHHT
jgi:hypothetical protein